MAIAEVLRRRLGRSALDGAHNARCAHTDGDIPSQRFRLVVTAQQGAIRFGGYYEIEVKGAVAFDGPTLGVGVRPILSEKLVK